MEKLNYFSLSTYAMFSSPILVVVQKICSSMSTSFL